jgi:hypothetical protein
MFGEIIRMVEISGIEHKVLFQKEPAITVEEVMQALRSQRSNERIQVLRMELDYELAVLSDALKASDEETIRSSKEKLETFRHEMLLLEM